MQMPEMWFYFRSFSRLFIRRWGERYLSVLLSRYKGYPYEFTLVII